MRFYGRNKELDILNRVYKQCEEGYGSITVLTGRRRIGKTVLAREFSKNKKHLYFFTSKKAELLLCSEMKDEYEAFSGKKLIGEIKHFPDLFEQLMIEGVDNPYVLIIDEFQEFYNINKSVYSDVQKIWDQYKFRTKVHVLFIPKRSERSGSNLLVPFPSECRDRKVSIPRPLGRNGGTKCLGVPSIPFGNAACPGVLIPFIGSIYSMMVKIFQDSKEPGLRYYWNLLGKTESQ